MSTRFLSDERLLADCRIDHYRGSGPGGQKRNKTSNAVRLRHLPSGTIVTATESRSLVLNKLHALRRLRLKLVADVREPIDLPTFSPPEWFLELRHEQKIAVSHRHPRYTAVFGLILDLLAALHGNPAAVAINLGVTTSTVVRLLEIESAIWTAANQIRGQNGLGAMTTRK